MNENLNLEMRLTANGSQLGAALNSAGAHVRTFANNASGAARRVTGQFQRLYQQLNGFSAISKLVVAAGGYSILSDAMRRNLEFEKQILEMKQTAQMTVEQAAEMRKLAIDAASDNMALPTEIAAAEKAFAAAGMKFDSIRGSILESARAAAVFRSNVEQIAMLDFDLQDKVKLDPSQIKDAHNMLLYHAKSGRYEAAPMAMEAPKYLNSVAAVGITGMKGLNFTGALTQVLMKLAPATQPSEVATFMEHGLGHITSRLQVKGLAKFGIDVKKFMPGGKFYGEGGVQGALDLAAAMKRAGLDNPFNLDKAGFREMYTKKFWKQMMMYHDDIIQAMKEGDKAALDDMVGRDKAEIERSNYAKVRQFEIAKEKGQLSDSATAVVGKIAALQGWAAENPGTAVAGGAALGLGGRWLFKRLFGGGGGGALNAAISRAGGGGLPVTVTNWPKGMGDPLKPSERLARLPGAGAAEAAGGAAAGSAALAAAVPAAIAIGGTALSAAAMQAVQANQQKLNDMAQTATGGALAGDYGLAAAILTASERTSTEVAKSHTGFEAVLDKFAGELVRLFGGVVDRPIEVHIDGHAVAASVNKVNGREAGRQ